MSPKHTMKGAARAVFVGLLPSVAAVGIHRHHSSLRSSYDYVIAGGGLSGLVVANRLTENPNITVLVVEYGDFDDSWNTAMPYYGNSLQNETLMFQVISVPMSGIKNRTGTLSLGATVGGGSSVNGMAVTRGQKQDYDAWEQLGSPGWGWSEIFKYFKKSSTINVPSDEVKAKWGYKFNTDGYGGGPWQNTFPPWQWPDTYIAIDAWKSVGISLRDDDGANGDILGIHWRPTGIDEKNMTRSSARTAYYNPAASRSNLDILVNNYVTKINTHDAKAVGADIFSRSNSTKFSVSVKKEVVLAAGAIHTPQILQLSGIGPAELLQGLNITVVKDLPGVGANFQDHPVVQMKFQYNKPLPNGRGILATNATFFNESLAEYMANRTGPLTLVFGNTRTILSLQNLTTPAGTAAILAGINTTDSPLSVLPPFYAKHPSLVAGYLSQLTLLKQMVSAGAGVFEFTWGASGVGVVLGKPLSRGTVHIRSANPHPAEGMPALDFGTFGHPFDVNLTVLGVRMARRIMASGPVKVLEPVELAPGQEAVTDAQIEEALRATILRPSNAHPVGTAALMREEEGGVVDAQLRVYGVGGLRVVDASILPLVPVANTQATMYAVAEKAADIIKADW